MPLGSAISSLPKGGHPLWAGQKVFSLPFVWCTSSKCSQVNVLPPAWHHGPRSHTLVDPGLWQESDVNLNQAVSDPQNFRVAINLFGGLQLEPQTWHKISVKIVCGVHTLGGRQLIAREHEGFPGSGGAARYWRARSNSGAAECFLNWEEYFCEMKTIQTKDAVSLIWIQWLICSVVGGVFLLCLLKKFICLRKKHKKIQLVLLCVLSKQRQHHQGNCNKKFFECVCCIELSLESYRTIPPLLHENYCASNWIVLRFIQFNKFQRKRNTSVWDQEQLGLQTKAKETLSFSWGCILHLTNKYFFKTFFQQHKNRKKKRTTRITEFHQTQSLLTEEISFELYLFAMTTTTDRQMWKVSGSCADWTSLWSTCPRSNPTSSRLREFCRRETYCFVRWKGNE